VNNDDVKSEATSARNATASNDYAPITYYTGLNFEIFPSWAPSARSNSILPGYNVTVEDDFNNKAGVFRASLEDLLFVIKSCTASISSTVKVGQRLKDEKLVSFSYSNEQLLGQLDELIERLANCRSMIADGNFFEKFEGIQQSQEQKDSKS
jgi:hypothetical protein